VKGRDVVNFFSKSSARNFLAAPVVQRQACLTRIRGVGFGGGGGRVPVGGEKVACGGGTTMVSESGACG
jgi:hypothetical protein